MSLLRSPASLAFVLLCGCQSVGNVTENNFAEKFADVFCDQAQKCNRGFFESEYSDMEDCIGEVEEDTEDVMDYADDNGCDFDEEEAQDFLESYAKATCEEVYEGDAAEDGEDIYDCDGNNSVRPQDTGATDGSDGSEETSAE